MTDASHPTLVCPLCKAPLRDARCTICGSRFSHENGIYDFVQGNYYDVFDAGATLPQEHLRGLALEVQGAETRARYYERLLRGRFGSDTGIRVLDCGCGNGLVVQHLHAAGLDAWGNDNSALRKWQWYERSLPDRLVVADGRTLPFQDSYFDAVICSGVLEHIGVDELGGDTYSVSARPTRDEERKTFVAELLRVTRSGGAIYLDFPNGSFPIDFWHGVRPGGARFHSQSEGFLPTRKSVVQLFGQLHAAVRIRTVSPRGRLAFRQISTRPIGRLLAPFGRFLFWLLDTAAGNLLLPTPINPYLVLEVDVNRRQDGFPAARDVMITASSP
jgi:SAM-dependent methyltransferase